MSAKTRGHAAVVLISLYFVFGLNAMQAQEALPRTSITPSLEKEVITQHEPTIVDIVFDNPSQESVDLNIGYDSEEVDLKVLDPDGKVFGKPHSAPKEGMRFSGAVHIAPGSASVESVVLNDWFHFDKVGTYRIEVNLSFARQFSSGVTADTHTTLGLTVLPRDEPSLVQACARLLARVQDSPSYARAFTAARALAEVDDPSAVPYLVEAMKRKEFTALMITALAHLKTQSAVEALISASQSSDSETSSLARAALLGLGKTERR
jgi:hypothetical protein